MAAVQFITTHEIAGSGQNFLEILLNDATKFKREE